MCFIQYCLCVFMCLYICHCQNVTNKNENSTQKPEFKMATNLDVTPTDEAIPSDNNITVKNLNVTEEISLKSEDRLKNDIPKTMTVTNKYEFKDNITEGIFLKRHGAFSTISDNLNVFENPKTTTKVIKIYESKDNTTEGIILKKRSVFNTASDNSVADKKRNSTKYNINNRNESALLKNTFYLYRVAPVARNKTLTKVLQNNNTVKSDKKFNATKNVENKDIRQNDRNNDSTMNVQNRHTEISYSQNVTGKNENSTQKPDFKIATNLDITIDEARPSESTNTVTYLNMTTDLTEIYLRTDDQLENYIPKTITVTKEYKPKGYKHKGGILKKYSVFDITRHDLKERKNQEIDKMTNLKHRLRNKRFEGDLFTDISHRQNVTDKNENSTRTPEFKMATNLDVIHTDEAIPSENYITVKNLNVTEEVSVKSEDRLKTHIPNTITVTKKYESKDNITEGIILKEYSAFSTTSDNLNVFENPKTTMKVIKKYESKDNTTEGIILAKRSVFNTTSDNSVADNKRNSTKYNIHNRNESALLNNTFFVYIVAPVARNKTLTKVLQNNNTVTSDKKFNATNNVENKDIRQNDRNNDSTMNVQNRHTEISYSQNVSGKNENSIRNTENIQNYHINKNDDKNHEIESKNRTFYDYNDSQKLYSQIQSRINNALVQKSFDEFKIIRRNTHFTLPNVGFKKDTSNFYTESAYSKQYNYVNQPRTEPNREQYYHTKKVQDNILQNSYGLFHIAQTSEEEQQLQKLLTRQNEIVEKLAQIERKEISYSQNVTGKNENTTRKPDFKMATNLDITIDEARPSESTNTVTYLNMTKDLTEIHLRTDDQLENDIPKTITVTKEYKPKGYKHKGEILKKYSAFDITRHDLKARKNQEIDKMTNLKYGLRNKRFEGDLFTDTTKKTNEKKRTVTINKTVTDIFQKNNILKSNHHLNLSKYFQTFGLSKNVKKRDAGEPFNIRNTDNIQNYHIHKNDDKNHEIESKIRTFYDYNDSQKLYPQIQSRINNDLVKKSFDEFKMIRRKTHFTLPNVGFKKDTSNFYPESAYSKQYNYVNEPRTEPNREQYYHSENVQDNILQNSYGLFHIAPTSEEELQLQKLLTRQNEIVEKLAQIERNGKTTKKPAAKSTKKPAAKTTKKPAAKTTKKSDAMTTKKQPAKTTKKQPAKTTKKQPAKTTKKQPAKTTKQQPDKTTKKQPAKTTKKQPAKTTKKPAGKTTKKTAATTTKKPTTGPTPLDFDSLIAEVEAKQKWKNYSFIKFDTTVFNQGPTTTRPTTILTLFDETEIRLALKDDPLVKRVLKMANMKRQRYVEDVRKYLQMKNYTHTGTSPKS